MHREGGGKGGRTTIYVAYPSFFFPRRLDMDSPPKVSQFISDFLCAASGFNTDWNRYSDPDDNLTCDDVDAKMSTDLPIASAWSQSSRPERVPIVHNDGSDYKKDAIFSPHNKWTPRLSADAFSDYMLATFVVPISTHCWGEKRYHYYGYPSDYHCPGGKNRYRVFPLEGLLHISRHILKNQPEGTDLLDYLTKIAPEYDHDAHNGQQYAHDNRFFPMIDMRIWWLLVTKRIPRGIKRSTSQNLTDAEYAMGLHLAEVKEKEKKDMVRQYILQSFLLFDELLQEPHVAVANLRKATYIRGVPSLFTQQARLCLVITKLADADAHSALSECIVLMNDIKSPMVLQLYAILLCTTRSQEEKYGIKRLKNMATERESARGPKRIIPVAVLSLYDELWYDPLDALERLDKRIATAETSDRLFIQEAHFCKMIAQMARYCYQEEVLKEAQFILDSESGNELFKQLHAIMMCASHTPENRREGIALLKKQMASRYDNLISSAMRRDGMFSVSLFSFF